MRWFRFSLFLFVLLFSLAFSTDSRQVRTTDEEKQAILDRMEKVQRIADSIVISFYGKVNFEVYVRLDTNHSRCIDQHGWGSPQPLVNRSQYTEFPICYKYKYIITHPSFGNDADDIYFRLDSLGRIIWEWNSTWKYYSSWCAGLQKNPDFSQLIDSTTAIAEAKKHGMKKPLSRKARIAWHGSNIAKDSDSTKTFSDVNWGVWAWEISSMEGEARGVGCVIPTGLRKWYINAFTGEFLSTRDD